jgi:hypothetical protein
MSQDENKTAKPAPLALAERRSWRPVEFAALHSLSKTAVYEEIRAGRLNARKCGAATIITEEDRRAWLNAMPPFETHRSPAPKRKEAAA